jgi:hypothetical protein
MHTLESKIKLKSGVSIPYIGIGTKNLIMDE